MQHEDSRPLCPCPIQCRQLLFPPDETLAVDTELVGPLRFDGLAGLHFGFDWPGRDRSGLDSEALQNQTGDLGRKPAADVYVAVARQDAEIGEITRRAEAQQHDAVLIER